MMEFSNTPPGRVTCMLVVALTLCAFDRAYSQESTPSQEASTDSSKHEAGEATSGDVAKTDSRTKSAAAQNSGKRRKRKPSQAAGSESKKRVVRQGGTSEPTTQISTGIPPEEAARLHAETNQFLSATEAELQQLASRTLNARQQEAIGQIRHYLDVARTALTENDIQRAHTLAFKAHLLSDDLLHY